MSTRKKAPPKPGTRRQRRSARALPVFWTDRAWTDLEAIGEYIARDNPAAARRWLERLMATAERAALAPMVGRRAPEVAREDVRETYLRTYRIVYRVTGSQCQVLTVFEGHQLFPADLEAPEGE